METTELVLKDSIHEDEELHDRIYGIAYANALQKMGLQRQELVNHAGIGFEDINKLIEYAHEMRLDKLVFSNMNHGFYHVSHKGELINLKTYMDYYSNILFVPYTDKDGNSKRKAWWPEGFMYMDQAYVVGEAGDGMHRPLYYRDYTVPAGYYSEERDAFNVAKPFPVFAKETGRDTSHVYTLISHIAGDCAMWLLAWLRAKIMHPTTKTQVVPIIMSRAQGSGKTTFAEVICKGLFGADNVLVTDQYDSQSRFNADYADALIVCQEEKEETDRRNPAAAIKSRATATTIRKEQKGIDPIYQESYTDFIMTTNKDVPIKFDGREDQRRFMIMEADDSFTRKTSDIADEVFTKLYGYDADGHKVNTPFVEDKDLIAQFKHELVTRRDIANIKLRQFPKTAAYRKCFTLPRTTESSEIESIMRAIIPFIKASLEAGKVVDKVNDSTLTDVIQVPAALQYVAAYGNRPVHIAVCRPLVFYDVATLKPYQHSVVERGIYDCGPWLLADYGVHIIPDMEPLMGGFKGINSRYKAAVAARFCLQEDWERFDRQVHPDLSMHSLHGGKPKERIGERLRVNSFFKVDPQGCFETVNEMKPGTMSLQNKSDNVQYMDTFLFESDSVSKLQYDIEQEIADNWKYQVPIKATTLYKDRLQLQRREATRLFNEGIAARVVYSGAKSYHILVRVEDSPQSIEEYKWLHAYLCQVLSDKLSFDPSVADPARLTRSPLNIERITDAYGLKVAGQQGLLYEDWSHVYRIKWRDIYKAWKNRPLEQYEQKKGRRLIPTKPEYVEAMKAMLGGTFWTDSAWDGRRQLCFFAGYRLCRLLGYSHEELWTDSLLLNNVDGYKHQNEVMYWKTRESSDIIQQIDRDIDAIIEEQGKYE